MRHFLSSEQSLVKSKQHFVYFKNIVIAVHYKIFDYYIKFVAVGKRKARFHKKLLGFVKIKLKRNRKSNCKNNYRGSRNLTRVRKQLQERQEGRCNPATMRARMQKKHS